MIHHFLQPNGNRNIVGSIEHVSCFHLDWYDKIIKIVYYVIHINFPIKSVDSCWIEVINMKFMKKYIKLRSFLNLLFIYFLFPVSLYFLS